MGDSNPPSSARRLRILVVDEEPPYPPDSGKKIRTWNLLKELAPRHDVTVVCFADAAKGIAPEIAAAGLRVVPVRARRMETGKWLYARLALNLLSRDPFSVSKHARRRFQQTVQRLLQTENFDLLQCEWTPYARYVLGNRRKGGATSRPVLIATHNIEADILRRRGEQQKSAAGRRFFAVQARRMERFEREVFAAADCVTAVSEMDARRAGEWGARQTGVVANGVATDVIVPDANAEVREKELLFLGSLDWFPNVDAVRFFLQEIFPLVRRRDAEARLNIVGRRPDDGLRALAAATDGVVLTGEVENVTPYLQQAAALVVPLRIGGGTRIKILEAMAAAKIVISTSIGAEGLNVEDGVHLLLADTPAEFAAKVTEVLQPSVSGASGVIGRNARQRVVEQYSWRMQAEVLEQHWRELVADRAEQHEAK